MAEKKKTRKAAKPKRKARSGRKPTTQPPKPEPDEAGPVPEDEKEAVAAAVAGFADSAEAVVESLDEHEQALWRFFATPGELDAAGSMSLDLYREQLDSRLMAEGVQEYLSFVLADETFAVNIFNIKEIIKPPVVTEVPRTEPVILGVLSLRGTIAAVVDLRRRLGLQVSPQTRKTRILIVQMEEELVGLLVDEVRHVVRLRNEDIEPPPGVFDRAEAEHIMGVGRQEGEMYTLLDLASVAQIDRYLKV